MKKTLENSGAMCYTDNAVNESGCLKGEPMNRQLTDGRHPNNQPITALYERLSRDDELQGPSNSIKNQQAMLEDYARKNGFGNLVHFTDDGISGTRFDRPGFVTMMDEIEAGNIGIVLCKDTSRLGRDYLRVGLFLETLRQKGVRLIAIGDNVDTDRGEDDFMPFRNIIAEWHARDTSRKIKAVYKSKGMSGKHTASHALYGYIKSPDDKNQWIVDSAAAEVVKRIFHMTIEGHGPYQIASILESEKIPCPSYYLAQKDMGNNKNKVFADPYRWYGHTISYILERREYMGYMVNFKTYKNNFKDKQRKFTPVENQVVFEGKHEEIIDVSTWETANRIRQNSKRRRVNSLGEANPLTGMLWCHDCGAKLYNERGYNTKNGKWKDAYICASYRKRTTDCTSHRINTDTVNELILEVLRTVSEYARNNEAEFTRQVNEMFGNLQAGNIKTGRKKLAADQKRHAELDRLIQRIYEDMVAGRITDKRFEVLSAEYEREQSELEQSIAALQADMDSIEDSAARAANFLELTRKYDNFTELTTPMLHEYVQKLVIHERAEKNKVFTTQKVEVYLNFIENFFPPVLPDTAEQLAPDPDEAERERKRQYHSDYYHRRKENDGKPLTPEDTRTPEQIAADEAARREYWKAYNRDYQREYQRKKAREKRASVTLDPMSATGGDEDSSLSSVAI